MLTQGDTARLGRKKTKNKNSVPATSIRKRRCQQLPVLRLPGVPLLNNIFTLTFFGGWQVGPQPVVGDLPVCTRPCLPSLPPHIQKF